MSNLREIQRRISSVKATSQITRTMEMVSTAKIRKALERAEEAEPYKDAISRISGEIFGSALTFGSAKKASAPGQLEVTTLQQILRALH